jgi:hypothetical protein
MQFLMLVHLVMMVHAMSVIFGIGMETHKVSVILQNVGAVHYIVPI